MHIDLSKTKSEMSSVGFASVTQYNMMWRTNVYV